VFVELKAVWESKGGISGSGSASQASLDRLLRRIYSKRPFEPDSHRTNQPTGSKSYGRSGSAASKRAAPCPPPQTPTRSHQSRGRGGRGGGGLGLGWGRGAASMRGTRSRLICMWGIWRLMCRSRWVSFWGWGWGWGRGGVYVGHHAMR